MKNPTQILIGTTLALTAACGYMLYRVDAAQDGTRRHVELIRAQQHRIAQLDHERAKLQQEVTRLQQIVAAAPPAQSQSKPDTPSEPATTPATAPHPEPTIAAVMPPPPGAAVQVSRLNAWMKTDKGREMMRLQQRVGIQRTYADFFRQREMTPEQIEQFVDAMSENEMRGLVQASSGANPDTIQQAWRERQSQLKQSLLNVLGSDGYAEFQQYQSTFAERGEVNQIAEQLEVMRVPLSEDQRKTILDAMLDERSRMPRLTMTAGMTPAESMQKQLEWKEEYDRRVRERAAQVLSPEQLRHFADYQQWRQDMQRAGMEFSLQLRRPGGRMATPANALIATAPFVAADGAVVAVPVTPPPESVPR